MSFIFPAKLLQATKQVCGVSSNHPWRKQTWWWNNQVEEAVREKRRCFKLWKAGGSRAAYNTAKRTSNRAVHQARSEVWRCISTCQANASWNQDVIGEKPVKNDAGQLSLDEEAKKEAWREHYERLLNVEFPWNPEDLSEESPVEGPSEPITLEMITKAISKMASGKAAGPSVSLRCWSPLGKLAQWRCVISLRTSSRRDAFQLTGRKASLSICTRAKAMLWIEATTGAWSWLSKWWRCWSVWWRDSSGKELRSMRCSVASCLVVALLMQFLLYVSYRRSTWPPTSRSTWPLSTWRKHLIEFHGMSSGGQCAN